MIGVVLKPQGIRGEIKIKPYAADVSLFEEWKTLYSVMGERPSAMQARGFESWTDATDDYGFSALPGGRIYSSTYNLVGQYAQFWCFGQQSETYGGYWQLRANSAGIQGLYSKSNGNSVRCLKD